MGKRWLHLGLDKKWDTWIISSKNSIMLQMDER
jgi:hypothetical protein